MSLTPPFIPRLASDEFPAPGTVSLRAMNDLPLLPEQQAAVLHEFELHKQRLRASLVDYLTRSGELTDGTTFRIQSNGPQHTVMVWPAGGVVDLIASGWGVFCIPADVTNPYGWTTPAVEGQNGTPAGPTDDNVGVTAPLALDRDKHMRAGRLTRFVKASPFGNTDFSDPSNPNISAQNFQHREWVNPSRSAVVIAYGGGIRVNGVLVDPVTAYPGYANLLWACVQLHQADADSPALPHLFAVVTRASAVHVIRKPLNGGEWESIADLDLTTLDANAAPDPTNNSMYLWVKKADCNASGTVISIWIQNPIVEEAFGEHRWVGITDVDMDTGAMTHTPAQGEVARIVTTGTQSSASTRNDDGLTISQSTTSHSVSTSSCSGVRQIAFEYVGDDKVFTELHFTGARVETRDEFNGSTTDGVAGTTTTRQSYGISDTRQAMLVRGDFSQRVAWVEGSNTGEHNSDWAQDSPADNAHGGTSTIINDDVTVHSALIVYFGGRGDAFCVRDQAVRTVFNVTQTFAGEQAAGYAVSQTGGGSNICTDTIYVDHRALDNGTAAVTPFHSTTTSDTSTGEVTVGDPAGAGTSDSNPSNTPIWGSCTLVSTLGGHPTYEFVTPGYMNVRVVDDFTILSVPGIKVGGSGVAIDLSHFQTYSTDPHLIAKYKIDPTLGVLKGIRLQ